MGLMAEKGWGDAMVVWCGGRQSTRLGDSNAPLKRFYIRSFGRLYVLPSFYRGWLLLAATTGLYNWVLRWVLGTAADEMSR